jgi:hypothetical protein
MKSYRKGLIAAGGFLAVLAEALRDGDVSTGELTGLALALVTAYGVYRVPNRPSA